MVIIRAMQQVRFYFPVLHAVCIPFNFSIKPLAENKGHRKHWATHKREVIPKVQ